MKAATKITKVTRDIFAQITKGSTNQHMLRYSILNNAGRRYAPSTVDKHILLLVNLGFVKGGTDQTTGHAKLETTDDARKTLDLGIDPLLEKV